MKKTLLEMMEEDGAPATAPEVTPSKAEPEAPVEIDPRLAMYMAGAKFPILGKPRDHQYRALFEAAMKSGHAWFADPGAGKTLMAIAEAGKLYEEGKIDGMIITAPNGPHEQWIDEQLPLWAGFRWKGIHNKQAPVMVIGKFLAAKTTALGVLAINHDALRTPKGKKLIDQFIEKFPRIYLVADESHKSKDITSMRSKELLKLGLRVAYRRALTGTPILKGLEDLWSQYEFVKPGLGWDHQPISVNARGTLNTHGYFGYRSYYCKLAPVPGNPRASRIVGYRNEEELRQKVRPYSTRIMSDEFMKGEKPDFIKVRTPMNDKQKAAYLSMKEHLLALLDSGTITAQNALVQMGKLQQIAAGFLYDQNPDTPSNLKGGWTLLGSNKLDATMDLLEQLEEPVIIWAPYRALQQMLLIEVGDRNERELWQHRAIYTRDTLDLWKKDRTGLLVGNQASGLGVGMNLQHAAANIYMSNGFSSEARWQSIKRTDRIGQTKQVRIWDLITPDTVELKALNALAANEAISRRTIDGLREMIL